MAQPEIRKTQSGAIVVDYGSVWFRVEGEVITRKEGIAGAIERRPANKREIAMVKEAITKSPLS